MKDKQNKKFRLRASYRGTNDNNISEAPIYIKVLVYALGLGILYQLGCFLLSFI